MKKFMTLAEQINAINHADEASMMAYLEGCANPHFLALSNVVASGNVNVIDEIIAMEELHTLVIRTMMAVLPDEMHHLVRNHKSYKEIDANIVFPGSKDTFIEMMLNLNCPYEPEYDVDSPEWIEEFNEKHDDPNWQMNVILGRSVPHIAFLIVNSVLDETVINSLLNHYSTDEDKISYVLDSEYDDDEGYRANLMQEAVTLQKHLEDRDLIFKLLAEHQVFTEATETLICWFYASGYMEFNAFKLFFDVTEDLPLLLKYRFRFLTLEIDD